MSNATALRSRTASAAHDRASARWAVLCFAAAMLCAASWRVVSSFDFMSSLDELYTATLIATPSIGHLWDGAVRGVDGNPPLYLTAAWLLTRLVPTTPEHILRPLNIVLLAVTTVLLHRLGRRVAAPLSIAAGLAALCAADSMPVYALLEMRTYALYLFLITLALWATLRVVDRPSVARAALLTGTGLLATLAHSFAGFYVLATLGAAGVVCAIGPDRRRLFALTVAAVPTSALLLAWIWFSFPAQSAVANPYGWIPQPGMIVLSEALTGATLLTPVIAIGLVCILAHGMRGRQRILLLCVAHRSTAALHAALAAYAALTVAAWLGSHVITSFFVSRYFIPNLLIAAVAFVHAAEAMRRAVRRPLAAAAAIFCGLIGFVAIANGRPGSDGPTPCVDAQGRFLEERSAGSSLPVVAVSPHAWLPRSRYAAEQVTLYPLDWRVVLEYPDRARNNAMDFHIMDILRDWSTPGSDLATHVLTTEEITSQHERLLVLDEAGRGWFDALRARMPMSATLVKQGVGCRLWDVTLRPAIGR